MPPLIHGECRTTPPEGVFGTPKRSHGRRLANMMRIKSGGGHSTRAGLQFEGNQPTLVVQPPGNPGNWPWGRDPQDEASPIMERPPLERKVTGGRPPAVIFCS